MNTFYRRIRGCPERQKEKKMSKIKKSRPEKLREPILAAILSALIIVMTFIPFTGYISYGPVEITTLHLIVIIGALFLGIKYGALLGGVWGITCFARAFTNPAWILFTNPLISVLPRILVGIVAAAVFKALCKTKIKVYFAVIISAAAATLTNTVLVLSSMYIFGGMIESYAKFFEMFKKIITTIIGLNGGIELAAAVIITPVVFKALKRQKAL